MDLEVSKYYVASQKKNVEYNSDNFFLLWKLSSNLGGHSKSGRGRGGRDGGLNQIRRFFMQYMLVTNFEFFILTVVVWKKQNNNLPINSRFQLLFIS